MFCTQCGNQIEVGSKFCTKCGATLGDAKKTLKKDIEKEAKQYTEKKPWTFWRLTKYALITIAIVTLLSIKLIIGAINTLENDAVRTNDGGINALNSGDTESAIRQFSDAAESATMSENKLNSLKNLGYAYSADGRTSEAIKAFQDALALTTIDSFEYHLITGEIEYLKGNPAKALQSYNAAYQKEPSNFQVNNALTLFYIDIEDLYPEYFDAAKAITYGNQAYRNSEPEMKSLTAQNLALAYYFNEDYSNAITYLKIADQSDPYTAYWLGLSYISIGDDTNGRAYLQKAVAGGVKVPPEVSEYLY